MRRAVLVFVALVSLAPASLHALDSVPKPEYRARRIKLGEKLAGGAALVLAAQEPTLEFMSYRQDEDFFYLTGWNEPGSALLVIGAGPGGVVPRLTRHSLLTPTARSSSCPCATWSRRSTPG